MRGDRAHGHFRVEAVPQPVPTDRSAGFLFAASRPRTDSPASRGGAQLRYG